MLESTLTATISYAASVGLIALVSFAVTAAFIWLTKLRPRLVCRYLRQALEDCRLENFTRLGLKPSDSRLRRQVTREARTIVARDRDAAARGVAPPLPFWFSCERSIAPPPSLEKALFCDLQPKARAELRAILASLDNPLKSRSYGVATGLAFVVALPLSVFYAPGFFDIGDAIGSNSALWPSDERLPAAIASNGSSLAALDWVGLTLTALLAAALSRIPMGWAFGHFDALSGQDEAEPEVDAEEDSADPVPPAQIGRDKAAVRAIAYTGGAFDSIMQLGVAHALLVIQARPPDAVVGLSSGALQAVALAEILQAGDDAEAEALLGRKEDREIPEGTTLRDACRDAWKKLPGPAERQRIHKQRVQARVSRLREFIAATLEAPKRLVDAALPDVYQVDSSNAVAPLQQPRFSAAERKQRAQAARQRTGLLKLYNDVLSIRFSVGTITRFVRRGLGLRASGEIRNRSPRLLVRISECFRLWVLAGVNLLRAAPLVSLAIRMQLGIGKTRIVNAGNLIFRFKAITATYTRLMDGLSFFLLANLWSFASIAVLTFFSAFVFAFSEIERPYLWGLLIPLAYLAAIVIWNSQAQTGSELDQRNLEAAGTDILKAMIVFVSMSLAWGALSVLAIVLAIAGLSLLPFLDFTVPTFQLQQSWEAWLRLGLRWMSIIGIAEIAILGLIVYSLMRKGNAMQSLLSYYNINDSLVREHGFRAYLVDLFDTLYYGESDFDQVVESSLNDERRGMRGRREPQAEAEQPEESNGRVEAGGKPISIYESRTDRITPIDVGLAVADTSNGKLEVVPSSSKVVDGLLAAVSISPYLPPVEIDNKLFVDGSNVTREPMDALLKLLRGRLNAKSPIVHVFNVSSLPVSRTGMPARRMGDGAVNKDGSVLLNLIDVVANALRLQKFRDATVERRLTELFTRLIPPGRPFVELEEDGEKVQYFRTWITPVELESDVSQAQRILPGSQEERRQTIMESIADGCRASLQMMIPSSVRATDFVDQAAVEQKKLDGNSIARCRVAVRHHLQSRAGVDEEILSMSLPGSDPGSGPGLSEVCRRCRLWRGDLPLGDTDNLSDGEQQRRRRTLRKIGEQSLKLGSQFSNVGPAWPHEREADAEDLAGDPHFEEGDQQEKKDTLAALKRLQATEAKKPPDQRWPRKRGSADGDKRATVSFLFSGGVFRGVYQMGVLNALHMAGLKPDVIAGASVGSITAAMIARTFSFDSDEDIHARIARLAAVYIAIDRLILTDRFADFVREFTLRAADTRFSIRQLDRLFRKYDYPNLVEFDHNVRHVLAGLERLLYVNPFQLNELVKDFRCREVGSAVLRLRELTQQLLDRFQIGDEALGSEPLQELMDMYVVSQPGVPESFDDFRDSAGIQLLATATNLTRGQLEVLGERPVALEDRDGLAPQLKEGLLASSAFPGVFQPRWSWNLSRATSDEHQYIDGGVMDNLPIDAVAQFLYRASRTGLIKNRPEAPHLAIAASLQVSTPQFRLPATRAEFARNWPALLARTKELSYNGKLDSYCIAEDRLLEVYKKLLKDGGGQSIAGSSLDMLALHVMAVKPNDLPSTFGFHPMLGFKRETQCESIAHGCASTILQIKKDFGSGRIKREHFSRWGVCDEILGREADADAERALQPKNWADALRLVDKKSENQWIRSGDCWLIADEDHCCPFSAKSLRELNEKLSGDHEGTEKPLPESTIRSISRIHVACVRKNTHLREI